jgi:phosphoenolpyruvate-protein kinase (PTS system EI component)
MVNRTICFEADCLTSDIVTGKLHYLQGHKLPGGNLGEVIVYRDKLDTESLMRLLNNNSIRGVIVNKGSFASHASGFLNGRGIQLAISPLFNTTGKENVQVMIDGSKNKIYLNPENETIYIEKEITNTGSVYLKNRDIKVFVDGKDEKELAIGLKEGADGVGILKTDWMNWNDEKPPSMEQHIELYKKCLDIIGKKRLNIRLFDVGGDKIPKWAGSANEYIRSPIGYRGIRALEVLKVAYDNQIKAIGKIAKEVRIGVVIPMVTNAGEIRTIKKRFLQSDPESYKNIVWGIMAEVPEAVLTINELLGECDFVRIGPGDLSQACLAMERDNIPPEYYSRYKLSPGVIKLIKIAAGECKKRNKEINICQDVEPSPELIRDIVLSGVKNFCVSHSCVKNLLKIVNNDRHFDDRI